jgi:hypothetical protein
MMRTGPRFSNRSVAAASEVGLIFLGITLAIAFENWNDERAERDEEQSILADLQADLRSNIDELEDGLEYNRRSVARIDSVLSRVEGRLPYTSDLGSSFASLENWASPYLNRSAYETLKFAVQPRSPASYAPER